MSKKLWLIFYVVSICFLSSCSKEEGKEIAVDTHHLVNDALDLTFTSGSNSVEDYIDFAGDVAETIEDIYDDDTEPNLV